MAPGVWVATAHRWSTTSTVVVAPGGAALVVDPALTRSEVAGLAEAVSRRGWRVTAGFATHPHFDHLLWSPSLGDAPRFATAACARVAHRDRARIRQECTAETPGHPADVRTALIPVKGGAVPWEGPAAVVLEHRAHAPGHAALWLPGPRVLLAGDMLSDLEVPLLDVAAEDPLGDYRTALDMLEPYVLDTTALVPGHGSVGAPGEARARLARDRAYLDALAAGRVPGPEQDPRLADPVVREQHEAQVAELLG